MTFKIAIILPFHKNFFYGINIVVQTNTQKKSNVRLTEGNNIMKKLEKQILRWVPAGVKFFDSDGMLNSLGYYEYTDGTVSKETAKNEVSSRVIGSQNPEAYKVVRLCNGGQLNADVYPSSRSKSTGKPVYRYGCVAGNRGLLAGSYVYYTNDGKTVLRETYDAGQTRKVVDEPVCFWDVAGMVHCTAMVEQVEKRKTRSDAGQSHNTQGQVTKSSEVLSENKRRK